MLGDVIAQENGYEVNLGKCSTQESLRDGLLWDIAPWVWPEALCCATKLQTGKWYEYKAGR